MWNLLQSNVNIRGSSEIDNLSISAMEWRKSCIFSKENTCLVIWTVCEKIVPNFCLDLIAIQNF